MRERSKKLLCLRLHAVLCRLDHVGGRGIDLAARHIKFGFGPEVMRMRQAAFESDLLDDAESAARLKRIKRLAWLVDAAFVVPGTKFRFGLNSVIGLAPGAGDAVLGIISLYIVQQSAQLGIPRYKLMQMVGNVALEVVGGSLPVIGDLFDVALKANLRNIRILEDHLRGAA